MGLQKKKVVIIGGSAGIGKATAERALDAGAGVVIASRHEEHLQEAKEDLGGRVETAIIDVRDTRGMGQVLDQLAPYDHLVFTAVNLKTAPFLDVDISEGKDVFNVKFWGQVAAAQYAAGHLREGGSITLLSGTAAHQPIEGMSMVGAVNAATEGLVRSLAVELSPIRINAVCPGLIDTHGLDATRRRELARSMPVRRMGEADHVAHSILYLIENPYTTGTVLFVDGGNSLV